MIDLDWINELIKQIPETPVYRKNLIEIAGYPKWENVNSNLLAFYLDENEEHGFGRLFLDSLLDMYDFKLGKELSREIFDSDYVVEREVSTELGGRIDIVVSSAEENESSDNDTASNWSVIVENKLFASLYNNLIDYWDSVSSEAKIGVVLTINPVNPDLLEKKHVLFVNILHKELIEKVKQNLSDYYMDSDDRHLLFLKEYISNVESYYKDKNKMQNLDKTLELFQSKREEIEELKKVDMKLLKYVSNSVFDIMQEIGFPPYSRKDSSKSKHFHVDANSNSISQVLKDNIDFASKFRFWINISKIRYTNCVEGVFELYGKSNTKYGDKLKAGLEKQWIFREYISIGTGGKSGAGYQHIFYFYLPIGDFRANGFDSKLKEILLNEIFNTESNLIDSAVIELKRIVENE